jgi:membrane protein
MLSDSAMNHKDFVSIAVATLRKWQQNNATLRAAALAFFIILPLPSLLLITADIYSQVYGQAQGTQHLIQQISTFLGPTIASLAGGLIQGAVNPLDSVFNSFFSIIFAVAGAVGAFSVLQDTLNVLWDVKLPEGRSIRRRVRERFVPFVSVLGSAFIVISFFEFTSLLFGAVRLPLGIGMGTFAASTFLFSIQTLLSFGSAILLFAVIFKEIPDTPIKWGDVWLSAIITAIIFTIANNVFRFYLQSFPVTTLAVAAGSLIILLLWIFLIAEIFLYGAQFTHCFAETVGSHSGKAEGHRHPWKRLQLGEAQGGKTLSEGRQANARSSEFKKENKENTQITGAEPAKLKREETPSAESEKLQTTISLAKTEKKTQKPNVQVSISETKSRAASHKDIEVNLRWRTKKKSSTEEESA